MTRASPPPLPARESVPIDNVEFRRRSLSASKSTGSLPVLSDMFQLRSSTRHPRPPQTCRHRCSNHDTRRLDILAPPQRTTAPPASNPGPHRAHTVSARTKPIPVPSLAARQTKHARSMTPSGTDFVAAPILPPPVRNANATSAAAATKSFGSSGFARRQPGSDSSEEEDDGDFASSLSPSSSFKATAGLRRSHAAADMTPGGLPDTSHANRRAPKFNPDCGTSAKQGFQCFAVCGHTVVTGSGDKVKVYRVGESASGVGEKLCTVGEHLFKEVKLTALEFRPPNHGIAPVPAIGRRSHGETADEGRYLWCGTKDGHIWELDIAEAQVVHSRQNVHSDPIQLLKRVGNKMLSLDEGGKISIWLPSADPDPAIAGLRLSNQPITQRIAMEKGSHACIVGQQLWVAAGPSAQRNAKDYAGSKGPRIRIYNPFADDKPFNALSKAAAIAPEMAEGVGVVTGGAVIPSRPDLSTLVTIPATSRSGRGRRTSASVCASSARMALLPSQACSSTYGSQPERAPSRCSTRTLHLGEPSRYGPRTKSQSPRSRSTSMASRKWGACKWRPAVWTLRCTYGTAHCRSTGSRQSRASENTSSAHTAASRRFRSRSTWMPPHLLTWRRRPRTWRCSVNAAQCVSDRIGLARGRSSAGHHRFWIPGAHRSREQEAYGQELVARRRQEKANDLGDRVSRQYRAWYDKLIQIVRYAMPPTCGYLLVQSESLVGLFTCVFVKQTEFKNIRELAISTVKTGMGGRYGNKGAVIARMVVQDTSIVFVNSHLAADRSTSSRGMRMWRTSSSIRRCSRMRMPTQRRMWAEVTAA